MVGLLHAVGGFHVEGPVEVVTVTTGLFFSLVGLWLALDAVATILGAPGRTQEEARRERRRVTRRELHQGGESLPRKGE